jgi:predicted MFS family arabinose efflux permease
LTLVSSLVVAASTVGQGVAGDFWSLVAARAVFGLGLGTLWTAGLAWSSGRMDTDGQTASLGVPVTVAGLGIMSGPAFSGLVADRLGVRAPFLVLGALGCLVSLALVRAPADERTYPRRALRETLRAARRDRIVLAGLVVIGLVGATNGAFNLLVPLELRHNGLSAGATGVLLSASAALFVIGSASVARLGARAATLQFAGVAALLYALATVIPVAAASTAALVAFLLVRSPFWSSLSTLAYPLGGMGAERAGIGAGAVMGLLNLSWGVAGSVAPVVAGAVAEATSERWAFACVALAAAATGGWLLTRRNDSPSADTVIA